MTTKSPAGACVLALWLTAACGGGGGDDSDDFGDSLSDEPGEHADARPAGDASDDPPFSYGHMILDATDYELHHAAQALTDGAFRLEMSTEACTDDVCVGLRLTIPDGTPPGFYDCAAGITIELLDGADSWPVAPPAICELTLAEYGEAPGAVITVQDLRGSFEIAGGDDFDIVTDADFSVIRASL
jgi:hypothetical protein